ncbi:hypothetical protein AC249_AIPGENE15324 [Exaiptasia diaphana]|nr:hypothetical protein AC249_AIPGENE15324 [Exaiptasia diaphana]
MIGKKRSFDVLKKNASKYEALTHLGDDADIHPDVLLVAEQLICFLYSSAEIEGRYWIFCQRRSHNEGLPPTSNSIRLHIQRANYQTLMWKRCLQAKQELPCPNGNGWELTENGLKPVLMTQDAAPKGLAELTVCTCQKSSCKSSKGATQGSRDHFLSQKNPSHNREKGQCYTQGED